MDAFKSNTGLISKLGEGNAYLIWAMGMYLETPDLEALASEALTDGPDDKKIDFIYLDQDAKRIVFAQGYYGLSTRKDSAPANKASDLNTACAWLLSGDTDHVPPQLEAVIQECRAALENGDVESIELLYVHNLPESVNVARELQTVEAHFRKAIGDETVVAILSKELGSSVIDHLHSAQDSHIQVTEDIPCPVKIEFSEKGPNWVASVMSVPGVWLHSLYSKHGESLFSANYRGFLGITKKRKINTGIRQSAEGKPQDFWVFNNGITILTRKNTIQKDGSAVFSGVSVINGAQTTGSIGSIDLTKNDLKNVRVLCRVIECADATTIGEIVKFNNTQNEIRTWDQYSNDPEQSRICNEFGELGHTYSRKRGFRSKGEQIGIEEVAQPLTAFHGRYQDANRGKNEVFRSGLYQHAFQHKKARHILFVYSLAHAIDARRTELKGKSSAGTIITLEEEQLALLRHLRFKNFLIAVTGRCLEPIIGRKVDSGTVAFEPKVANSSVNTLSALAGRWVPIVESILAFVTSRIKAPEFSAKVNEEKFFDETTTHVNAMLLATRAATQHSDFAKMVADS